MIKLRRATKEDLNALLTLNQKSLGYQDITFEQLENRFNKINQLHDHRIIVASVDEVIAGYIHIQDYDTLYMPTYIEILALCVVEEFQNDGIGTALIKYVEAFAFDKSVEFIRLGSSLKRNGAHCFYEKQGYYLEKTHKIFHKKIEDTTCCKEK